MITIALLIPLSFLLTILGNQDYFDQVKKDLDQGATWHYVGQQEIDPNAKSITIDDTHILWKLKK